jgi:hypothetical protein
MRRLQPRHPAARHTGVLSLHSGVVLCETHDVAQRVEKGRYQVC